MPGVIKRLFIDTSAFYGCLVPEDQFHQRAARYFEMLQTQERELATSNYVIHESVALLQARRGTGAVQRFFRDLLPLVSKLWVAPDIHDRAVSALLSRNRRDLSLTDCTSFEVMRSEDIQDVFAFDEDFTEEGFKMLPLPDYPERRGDASRVKEPRSRIRYKMTRTKGRSSK